MRGWQGLTSYTKTHPLQSRSLEERTGENCSDCSSSPSVPSVSAGRRREGGKDEQRLWMDNDEACEEEGCMSRFFPDTIAWKCVDTR